MPSHDFLNHLPTVSPRLDPNAVSDSAVPIAPITTSAAPPVATAATTTTAPTARPSSAPAIAPPNDRVCSIGS